jgi:hypothetical protein
MVSVASAHTHSLVVHADEEPRALLIGGVRCIRQLLTPLANDAPLPRIAGQQAREAGRGL